MQACEFVVIVNSALKNNMAGLGLNRGGHINIIYDLQVGITT